MNDDFFFKWKEKIEKKGANKVGKYLINMKENEYLLNSLCTKLDPLLLCEKDENNLLTINKIILLLEDDLQSEIRRQYPDVFSTELESELTEFKQHIQKEKRRIINIERINNINDISESFQYFQKQKYYEECNAWSSDRIDCSNVILGPKSISLFRLKSKYCYKNILIFGENHLAYTNRCNRIDPLRICNKSEQNGMFIEDFIDQLIVAASDRDLCLDLFLEKTFGNKKSYDINYPRNKSMLVGGGGLRPLQSLISNIDNFKRFDNIRIHDFDLRGNWENWEEDDIYFDHEKISRREESVKGSGIISMLAIHDLLDYTTISLSKDDYKIFLEYILGAKELNDSIKIIIGKIYNFSHDDMTYIKQKIIYNEIEYVRKKIIKEYTKYMRSECKLGEDLRNVFIDLFIDHYESGTTNVPWQRKNRIDISLVLTDLYVISRMFMDFDLSAEKKINNRNPTKCDDTYKTPQFIIMYCGNAHAQLYKNIIETYVGKPDISYSNDKSKGNGSFYIPLNDLKKQTMDIFDLIDMFLQT